MDDTEHVKYFLQNGALQVRQNETKEKMKIRLEHHKKTLKRCVSLGCEDSLELLIGPILRTMTNDDKFLELLLRITAENAPTILGTILRRVNPTAPFYHEYLCNYIQLVVLHEDQQDEWEAFRNFVWKSGWPLHAAIRSSQLCRGLAQQMQLSAQEFLAHADAFQSIAVQILESCTDQLQATAILTERSNPRQVHSTPLHYAVTYGVRAFVAHKYFQRTYEKMWFAPTVEAAAECVRLMVTKGATGPIERQFTRPRTRKVKMDPDAFRNKDVSKMKKAHGHSDGAKALANMDNNHHGKGRRTPLSASRNSLMSASKMRLTASLRQDAIAKTEDDMVHKKGHGSGVKFVAATMTGRFLDRLWTFGICVSMIIFLTIMSPIIAIAPLCPAKIRSLIERLTKNTEFDCAFFKFFLNTATYVGFIICLGVYILMTSEDDNTLGPMESWWDRVWPETAKVEFTLVLWVIAYTVGEFEQLLEGCYEHDTEGSVKFSLSNGIADYFSDGQQIFDVVMWIGFCVTFGLRFRAHEGASDAQTMLDWSDLLLSMSSWMAVFRLLHVCSINSQLGPLWVMLKKMTRDVLLFLYLFGVTFAGFLLAFSSLLRSENRENFVGDSLESTWTIVQQLCWLLFDLTGETAGENFGGGELSGTKAAKYYVYTLMVLLFLIQAVIMLTNLLIAMMSNTYSTVKAHADMEWKFSTVCLIDVYRSLPTIPPPLNLLCIVPRLLRWIVVSLGWIFGLTLASGARVGSEDLEAKKRDEALYQHQASKNIHKQRIRIAVMRRYIQQEKKREVRSTEARLKRLALEIRELYGDTFGIKD